MKKGKNRIKSLLMVSAFFCFIHGNMAQSYTDSLSQDNRDIISSIAPYKEDVRSAILDVSQYPQALVKLERVQSRSSQSFQDAIYSYPREDQEKLYEISRFPDLVKQLASRDKITAEEVKPLLKDFPAASQARMLEVYNTHYNDIVKMNDLYQSSQDAMQKIIHTYPADVQSDFQKVVAIPDVMNLLTENIDLTVSLGEEYKADPNGVKQQLDSLSNELTQKNTEDLAAYKKEVESDPELQSEMKNAATDFATSYDQPDNPTYVTNNYYDNYPYPYWFSYPYWYTTPIWYPRPMYYHTGFYYGPGGGMVVVGLPSHVYSGWFFGSGYRRYPNLYRRYNVYYNIHRNNIYRGFNHAAYYHFNHINNFSGRTGRNHFNVNRWRHQMNINSNHFNQQGMHHFHSNTYHGMGWQNIGGGRTGGGMQRSNYHFNGGGGRHMGGGRGRH